MSNSTTFTSFRIFAIISLLNAGQILAGSSSSSSSSSRNVGSISDLSSSIKKYRRYHTRTLESTPEPEPSRSPFGVPFGAFGVEKKNPFECEESYKSSASAPYEYYHSIPRGGSSLPVKSTGTARRMKRTPIIASEPSEPEPSTISISASAPNYHNIPRGGDLPIPAGWHPYGYGLTETGLEFLEFEGSRDSDIGRFLLSLKSGRKKQSVLREQWVEIVRVSKSGQSMRILRTLDSLIEFCVKAGFIA